MGHSPKWLEHKEICCMAQGDQVRNGKAFEYALAKVYANFVEMQNKAVILVDNDAMKQAKGYYNQFSTIEQAKFNVAATQTIETMVRIEPGILAQKNDNDNQNIILDSDLEYIDYKGINYPIRIANFRDMNVRIATMSLDKALYDEETGLPTSQVAEAIDEILFYFVQDEEIFLPQHELLQLLKKQIA